jgi:hypothetical protein
MILPEASTYYVLFFLHLETRRVRDRRVGARDDAFAQRFDGFVFSRLQEGYGRLRRGVCSCCLQ